jgi:heptosyltransferase-2
MRIPQHILIIRFSSLGDIILASPLIRALRNSFPRATIDFLLKSEYAPLLRYNPHLSKVIELTGSDKEELRRLKNDIRGRNYDTIVDIHNSLRSRWLRMFSGARYVYVINKFAVRRFLLVNVKRNLYKDTIPVPRRYLDTAKALGMVADEQGLEVFIPEETISSVNALMNKFKPEKHAAVIGLVPTAHHFTKRWPAECFVKLGVRLAKEHHAKLFLFGGENEVDYCGDIAQMINAESGSAAAESLAGKISILQAAAVLDYCSVVVSNDSGLMHLAAARQRKIVALFGSTVKELGFFPYRTENIVLERNGLACRPCSHVGLDRCPEGHFKCMKDISVDEVVEAVNSLLKKQ